MAYIKELNDYINKIGIQREFQIPKNKIYGDLAIPLFNLEINELQKQKLLKHRYIKEINEINNFLNVRLNYKEIIKDILMDSLEYNSKFKSKRIMIEFSSPNAVKPMHLGHLRNNFLGDSVANILKEIKADVIKANLINDRGIQMSKVMLAYLFWKDKIDLNKKFDHVMGDLYVMFEKNKTLDLEKKAQELLIKWENNDPETIKLWKCLRDKTIEAFKETYNKLNIKFDVFYYESEIYNQGKSLVLEYYNKGIFKRNDKGIYVDLSEFNLPNKIVLRKDNTAIYITQDIYLAKLKFDQYNLDESIYCVASEQELYFKQLFAILKKMNLNVNCYHLSYGMVYLPEGRMKSREGKIVDADELIDSVINLAKQEIKKRYKDLDENEINKRSEIIGIAALKFFLLKIDPKKDITFYPEKSIEFEGETGPYILYTLARIFSLFEKAINSTNNKNKSQNNQQKIKTKESEKQIESYDNKKQIDEQESINLLYSVLKDKELNNKNLKKISNLINQRSDYLDFNELEINIIRDFINFQTIIENAADNFKPNLIANYLIELSQKFNKYYHDVKIINTNKQNIGLFISFLVGFVIKKFLRLLNIDYLEKM